MIFYILWRNKCLCNLFILSRIMRLLRIKSILVFHMSKPSKHSHFYPGNHVILHITILSYDSILWSSSKTSITHFIKRFYLFCIHPTFMLVLPHLLPYIRVGISTPLWTPSWTFLTRSDYLQKRVAIYLISSYCRLLLGSYHNYLHEKTLSRSKQALCPYCKSDVTQNVALALQRLSGNVELYYIW